MEIILRYHLEIRLKLYLGPNYNNMSILKANENREMRSVSTNQIIRFTFYLHDTLVNETRNTNFFVGGWLGRSDGSKRLSSSLTILKWLVVLKVRELGGRWKHIIRTIGLTIEFEGKQ